MSEPSKTPPKAPSSGARQQLQAFHDEAPLQKVVDRNLIRRMLPHLRPHRRYVLGSLGLLVLLSLFGLWRPLLMGKIVDVAGAGDPAQLFRYGMTLAVLVVSLQVLGFVQTYWLQIAGAKAMASLRADVFATLQRVTLRYFDRTPVGRLVTRATSDVDAVGELFASGALNALGDLVSLIGIVSMMLWLDWQLSLIAFASLPLVFLITNYVRRRSREAFRDIRAKTAKLNSFLNEQITGIAVIQAYAREEATASEFDEVNVAYRDANRRAIYYEALLDAAIEMVGTVCIASLLFWAGLDRIGARHIEFSLVVVFTQYIKQFFEPVSMLASRYTMLQSALAGAERVVGFLDEVELEAGPRAAAEAPAAPSSDRAHEAIALDHVTFSYKSGKPVLRDVSLTVERGAKVALVGATGAGKSTVTSLALRLYEAEQGEVRVMGRDVRTCDPCAVREQFAVVPQEVYLFAGTVLSNISLSLDAPSEAERARAESCLRRVGADEILRRGLDAKVEERGQNFSAGERQLIAFARALYRDAPILMLDEATASIDSHTEARLQKALLEVIAGRTAVVVAHRLSTIRAMDRICVFHRGQLVEQGSHNELMQLAGVYAKLYELQRAAEAREAGEAAASAPGLPSQRPSGPLPASPSTPSLPPSASTPSLPECEEG